MSRQYEQYERTTRTRRSGGIGGPRFSGLTHWVPLALTVAAVTVGIAAWIWSERHEDEEEDTQEDYRPPGGGENYADYPPNPPVGPGEPADGVFARPEDNSNSSYIARMSGALRRTPSPQQFLDGASRTVAAGVAAAGTVVGNALSTIREEDKNAFKDHQTWSEEAIARQESEKASKANNTGDVGSKAPGTKNVTAQENQRKRTVAIVVSADDHMEMMDEDADFHHEHASILSHLPTTIDFTRLRLFVLIYCPSLKQHPLDSKSTRTAESLSSSFSNIEHEQATSQGEEIEKSSLQVSSSPAFKAMWSQAQTLVENETMIMPFTTASGHVHMLRHLNPDIVYLQESLAGFNGDVITHLQTWLRQDVVLVVGADGGHGGLADSESEAELPEVADHWWEKEDRVGRGRGVVVVEGLRVGDDWARRIEGKD